MKVLLALARIIVGLLFIFSGLVKANDPLGLSYKMKEFFEIWGIMRFDSWTLASSVLMNAFEIIAGFAILLGWRTRIFSWLLLLLIVFFTFLTGYTYITGKPTNCGCFGDCLLISSKASFLKDVALTVLIAFIFWNRNKIRPLFPEPVNVISMLLVTIGSFAMQWYTLNYLPFVDCLPFKKGNNISEKMKMPKDAVPDSTVINFVYEKEGKRMEFDAMHFPSDFDASKYKFINRYDKIIRAGKNNQPPIKGFALSGSTNIDSTEIVLSQPYAVVIIFEDFSTPLSKWKTDFNKIISRAKELNIPVYAITNHLVETNTEFAAAGLNGVQVFKCDYTAVRTAARVNPTLMLLKQGTIEGKWSYRRMTEVLGPLSTIPKQLAPVITPVSIDTLSNQPTQ
jgi:uncharacterized membrane protein YphA (DoxX/SURF4 family)